MAVFEGKDIGSGFRSLDVLGSFSEDNDDDDFVNLSGKLVIRGPDGNVHMALSQEGDLQIREKKREDIF